VLRRLLAPLGPAPLAEWLERYFTRPGWVLAPDTTPRWTGFVLEPASVLGGSAAGAAIAAALVEVAVAAIDIADDLIDGDWSGDLADQHRATNAAVGLGLLGQAAIPLLGAELGAERALRIAERAARWSLASVSGQDQDVLNQHRLDVSEDEALAVTRCKSGSLVRMAVEVGALVATDDEDVVRAVGDLGEAVGTIAQLLNDLAGVDTHASGQKLDFRARTKTVPVAFLLHSARDGGHQRVLDWYTQSMPTPVEADGAAEQALSQLARDLGALDFAWVLADAQRREADAALRAAAARLARPELLDLLRLLPSVRARAARRTS
jgi:geranylgeranyl pyrophosphate synthase